MSASAPDLVRPVPAAERAPQLVGTGRALATGTPADGDDDGDIRTIDELVRKRARTHADHIVVSYPSSGIEYVDYTMQQLDVFAYRVARVYEDYVPPRSTSGEKPRVVAILGPSNLDYLVTILALTKLGHTVLFLSTRITQEAVDSLLASTDANFLLCDARYSAVADAARNTMPELGVAGLANGSTYNFPVDVYTDTNLTAALDPAIEADHAVFIIHSSGSTGLPKAIPQTQKSAVANYAMHLGLKAFITLPLFHNHGISNMFRALHSVRPIHLYNADLPLTREHLTSILARHDFEVFYGVPYALKLLAETEEGVALLRMLKIVMFGGSACPDDLGDYLTSEGVNLVGHYGATEVGQLMTSFRLPGDKAWNYLREPEKLTPHLHWAPRGPSLFECCVLPGWPSKVASNRPDGSYATKDLFEPHPSIPRAWRYVARLDDTIVLVNGEKFNPVRMEGTIRTNRAVKEAVVFGAGRPNLGLLVVPSSLLEGKSTEEVLNDIWRVVESANESVEGYARISKDMVRVLPVGSPYPQTDKGSVIRQAFYKQFTDRINEAYDAVEERSGDVKQMAQDKLRAFLRGAFADVLPSSVNADDETDFFSLGLDSLQAMRVRSEILKAVDIGGNKLSQTIVFDHPTIKKLTAYLLDLGSGQAVEEDVPIEGQMRDIIEEYSEKLVSLGNVSHSYVVTGSTGSLGIHIVTLLASDPSVTKVYCLVRAISAKDAATRLRESLIQRRLDHTLSLHARRKLIAIPSDLSRPDLGVDPALYEQIAKSLDSVIHCAWSVNFNMQLSSFKDNIAGVSHLLNLCARARASFNFCSSVSAVARCTTSPVPESAPELRWAQGMGYAQSKAVAEHLCSRAGKQLGVPVRVLRIGQIVGDTIQGVWNASEAIPMMLRSAMTVGALPKLKETPAWLPADVVAKSILEIAKSDASSAFFNIANPKSFDWTEDLLPALRAAGLEFEEVEPKDWIRLLRESDPDPVRNPPIKLLDFFASKYDREEFAPSISYSTEHARAASASLSSAQAISQAAVEKFVRYFRDAAWKTPLQSTKAKTVVIVAGPCGTGKSTLAQCLSGALGVPFVEGDELHSKEAVGKMARGVALTDEDREAWLQRVGKRALEGVGELGYDAIFVSCSALKKAYRDALRGHVCHEEVRLVFLDLQCGRDALVKRLENRRGHYMSAEMVDGQLAAYEGPGVEETSMFPLDAEGSGLVVAAEAKWVLNRVGVIFEEKD